MLIDSNKFPNSTTTFLIRAAELCRAQHSTVHSSHNTIPDSCNIFCDISILTIHERVTHTVQICRFRVAAIAIWTSTHRKSFPKASRKSFEIEWRRRDFFRFVFRVCNTVLRIKVILRIFCLYESWNMCFCLNSKTHADSVKFPDERKPMANGDCIWFWENSRDWSHLKTP